MSSLETSVLCDCCTTFRHSDRARVQSSSAQFFSPPGVSAMRVQAARAFDEPARMVTYAVLFGHCHYLSICHFSICRGNIYQ